MVEKEIKKQNKKIEEKAEEPALGDQKSIDILMKPVIGLEAAAVKRAQKELDIAPPKDKCPPAFDDAGMKKELEKQNSTINSLREQLNKLLKEPAPPPVVIPKPKPIPPTCEAGWIAPKGGKAQRCYKALSVGKLEHNSAQAACRKLGGDLAIIHSAAENDAAKEAAGGTRAWIGLNDKTNEGKWYWPDNSPASYTSWWRGEPNDARGEDCTEIGFGDGKGMWNDLPCTKYKLSKAVCSKPSHGVVPKNTTHQSLHRRHRHHPATSASTR